MRVNRRALLFSGLGVVLAGILAVVLFVGVGTGGGTAAAIPSVEQQAVGGEAGLDAATASLLQLTVQTNSTVRAPDFHLTDQNGRPMSMGEFRGKVVVFSANDDQCEDLCTFLATDIVLANRDLGAAAKDVVWAAVNANPYYPTVASTREWTDQHGLGDQPNWYYGTASPGVLRSVWAAYGVQVTTDPQARTVDHSTGLTFVTPGGVERATADFGINAANTTQFAHGMAQMADDLLPTAERVRVAGPETPAPNDSNDAYGATAPAFDLPYFTGGTGKLSSASLAHQILVLNFWTSTCTACRTELPALEAVWRAAHAHDPTGVAFVGVDVSEIFPSEARALLRAAGVTYPTVADASGTLAGEDRISSLPYTIVLQGGNVQIRHPGVFTAEQLTYILADLDPKIPGD